MKGVSIIAKKENKVTVSFIDEPASETVTGSLVYIKTPNHNIIIDAGLHQTNDRKQDYLVNNRKFREFKSKDIDLIFLSHNHADHSLLCPRLYLEGCNAATIIPYNSKGVLAKMAEDCAYINERDVEVINNQEGTKYKPIYTNADIELFLKHAIEKPINEKIIIDDEIAFEFIPSGHLLSGCQILLYITYNNRTETILYTGDLGNRLVDNQFVGKLQKVKKASLVIGEATYGDRPDIKTGKKERQNDLNKLKTIIDTQVCQLHGRVLIPSFAQSRCQQLAYMIYQLYKDDPNFTYKVYIDSPLAINIFKEYLLVCEDDERQQIEELMKWENIVFVKESEDSKSLVLSKEACIVISTSGMCQVGRIRHHLKSLINNPNATVLFVGFSTEGSLASMLKDNKRKTITIDNKEYCIKCASYSLKSMSGHAPQKQLVDYYSSIQCNKIVLHHGSMNAKTILKHELEEKLSKECKSTRVVIANSSLKFSL